MIDAQSDKETLEQSADSLSSDRTGWTAQFCVESENSATISWKQNSATSKKQIQESYNVCENHCEDNDVPEYIIDDR